MTSRDEVGRLAKAFNSMSEELEQRMETISTDRNKLVAILSSMVEGVVAIDQDERVLHLNQVAAEMLDVPDGNQEGRPIWELTRVREACAILSRAIRDRQDLSQELTLSSMDGDRSLVLRACPIHDSSRDVVGAVLVLHDVTEESRFEVVRRDFVANVSHELKTPLTAIRGYVETMVDDAEMDGETRARFLDRIRSQVLRLGTLVTDLLTLSRLDSRDDHVDFHRMDLRQTVTESVHGLRGKAETKGLSMSVDIGDAPLWLVGDPEAMRQLIDNLVGNAINYTPSGGWVRLRLSADEEEARLQVSDNGVGISPKDRERVFERFFRVDKARSRELGGTGLGLAIVKNVALAHGGSVSVDSELGRGTTFTVRLPLTGPES
ncbi:MAG: ATP-binding protein [Planctomycetota bacterium]